MVLRAMLSSLLRKARFAVPRPLICTRAPLFCRTGGCRNPHVSSIIRRSFTYEGRGTPNISIQLQEIQKEDERVLKLIWSDGSESRYPYVFLQENCKCPDCFEPSSKQRKVDVMKDGVLDSEYKEAVLSEDGNNLKCVWANGHQSVYSAEWLHNRRLVKNEKTKSKKIVHDNLVVWSNKEMQDQIPCYDYEAFMKDDRSLFDALYSFYRHGLMLIDNGPAREGVYKDLAERISYLRPTHYGEYFDVKSKADPSNLAYTMDFIPFHVDLLYLTRAPDIQILHCVEKAPDGMGGDSLFIDAFNVAIKLMEIDYPAFEILSTVDVPFHDVGSDAFGEFSLGYSRPIIEINEHGRMTAVNFNNFTRGDRFLNLTTEETLKFYDAFYLLNKMMYQPENLVTHRLHNGQTVVFHNTRVLHSRTGIEPGATRLLQGNYYEWDVIFSKLRCLHARLGLETPRLHGESNDFF